MMELVKAENGYMDALKELYLTAFPEAERKPLDMMERLAAEGKMELLAILEDGKFVGLDLNMLLPGRDIALLDYFAIRADLRGGGYGSRALALVLERFRGKRMIFEIERPDDTAPNAEERARRKHFYLKNGLQENQLFASCFGVEFELLSAGGPITMEDYRQAYEETLGEEWARRADIRELS